MNTDMIFDQVEDIMKSEPKSGRCKIFHVDAETVFVLLGNWRHAQFVSLPLIKGLPEGYVIRAVDFDFAVQGFRLLVEHESFPEVTPGGQYPRGQEGFVEFETVEIPDELPRRKSMLGAATETVVGTATSAPPVQQDILRFQEGVIGAAQAEAMREVVEPQRKKKVGWEFLGAP